MYSMHIEVAASSVVHWMNIAHSAAVGMGTVAADTAERIPMTT